MHTRSLWQNTAPSLPQFPVLDHDLQCEAAVVGAGMAGILTAWFLQQAGLDVVVLESHTPCAGVTAHTTAKITSQHGLIYRDLIATLGKTRAGQYAQANQKAIQDYADLVDSLGIECDFRRADSYVFDRTVDTALAAEVSAANSLGIPAVLTRDTELPFQVAGAVKFPNQACFHPLKFLSALVPRLKIYAHTTARHIERNTIHTDHAAVTAQHIVVATHFPFFLLPGLYFIRMHQERSYAVSLSKAAPMEGLYLDAQSSGYSFRSWQDQTILTGAGHRTGRMPDQDSYEVLTQAAQRFWPECEVTARWSTQDCMPADRVPYIGAYSGAHQGLYVATGFQKWGMSSSMAAARILSDLILGRDNPNAGVFTPHRLPAPAGLGHLLTDGSISAAALFSQAFYVPRAQLRQIGPGEGQVVTWNGKKVGAYRSEDNQFYLVSTRCPHMGCQLAWNREEKTWDCPCHGSRFSYQGERLEAPASDDLQCTLLSGQENETQ